MSFERDAIRQRIEHVRRRIAEACTAAGREAQEVTLLAVSKTKPEAAVRAAYAAGQRDFGENYAQELRRKADALQAEASDLRWHFVGPLQRNKVRHVVGRAKLLHSITTAEQVAAIEQRAASLDVVQDVLLQLNLSGESTKAGITAEAAAELVRRCEQATHVRCVGLMTMPPPVADPRRNAPYFEQARRLRDELGGPQRLPHLSMGMTDDFEVAIEHGATIVRVGTAIFGGR